jgi:hypothetical protein
VVWEDSTSGNGDIFYRKSPNGGGAMFGGIVNLSNTGHSGLPALAVSGNNVYVVWDDNTPGSDEIFYRKSPTGGATFGSTVNLSNNAGLSQIPAVAVSGNNVYVIREDSTSENFEILLRKSVNAGATFGSTINVSQDAGNSFSPVISISTNNF